MKVRVSTLLVFAEQADMTSYLYAMMVINSKRFSNTLFDVRPGSCRKLSKHVIYPRRTSYWIYTVGPFFSPTLLWPIEGVSDFAPLLSLTDGKKIPAPSLFWSRHSNLLQRCLSYCTNRKHTHTILLSYSFTQVFGLKPHDTSSLSCLLICDNNKGDKSTEEGGKGGIVCNAHESYHPSAMYKHPSLSPVSEQICQHCGALLPFGNSEISSWLLRSALELGPPTGRQAIGSFCLISSPRLCFRHAKQY